MTTDDTSRPAPDSVPGQDASEEAEQLRKVIEHHNNLYYNKAAPEISDAAYDTLFRRLQELEAAFPSLRVLDSPTRRVGATPKGELPALEHAAPMLSLDSVHDAGAVRRFDQRMRNALGDGPVRYILEPKLDGASVELVYQDGVLVRAVTRGDGRFGEGVTENVRTISSVPLRLRGDVRSLPSFLAVRGEALMYASDFKALNRQRIEEGEEPYQNSRNATSGALRQLDSRVTARRPLTVLAYDILAAGGVTFELDSDGVAALQDWGLKVPERIRAAGSVDEIIEYHRAFDADRETLDYEIDGVVAKLDDLSARSLLGSTSHHPRWAVAFKFEPRKEVTRLDEIVVSVGRTGVLTPVALLRPADVGGVTVSRASLHNREELKRKDIRKGDLVRIQRAGDVIPQVVERVEEERERGEPFVMPTACPSCGTETVERGPFTLCPNHFACRAQLKGRIAHFGSRHAMDISGLGEETAKRLVDHDLVREIADLFDLVEENLVPLEGFGEVSARNLVAAIRGEREPDPSGGSLRRAELTRFLAGLGIPEVGVNVARDLAVHFQGFDPIRAASDEKLQEVPGIGPKMSVAIRTFLHDPAVSEALDHLVAKGFNFLVPPPAPVKDTTTAAGLSNKTFVLTGALETFRRSTLKKALLEAGGQVADSVSSKTDFLVVGARPSGSKVAKAEQLGTQVLTEEDLLERLAALNVDLSGQT